MAEGADLDELIDTLKVAVAALREAGIPFMLGGSLAAWARGGPAPDHRDSAESRNRGLPRFRPAGAGVANQKLGPPRRRWRSLPWTGGARRCSSRIRCAERMSLETSRSSASFGVR